MAAVVAAPIRRECDVVFARPSVVSCSKLFMSFLVRNFLLAYVKSGPSWVGCVRKYRCRAVTGQRSVSFDANLMVVPWRNGSVFDILIAMLAMSLPMLMSVISKVEDGSYFVLCDDVYSDTLRNPKNAVVMAAHSMSLSSYILDELKRFSWIRWSMSGVMGCLSGTENFLPSDLLIPLRRR